MTLYLGYNNLGPQGAQHPATALLSFTYPKGLRICGYPALFELIYNHASDVFTQWQQLLKNPDKLSDDDFTEQFNTLFKSVQDHFFLLLEVFPDESREKQIFKQLSSLYTTCFEALIRSLTLHTQDIKAIEEEDLSDLYAEDDNTLNAVIELFKDCYQRYRNSQAFLLEEDRHQLKQQLASLMLTIGNA